ncbi:MAG: hypothetical protein QOE70_4913 [Chthoniobacter sp.]|jgi:hypothetical protein|nr:hypothetical protein [Chthoniobacter sp.]
MVLPNPTFQPEPPGKKSDAQIPIPPIPPTSTPTLEISAKTTEVARVSGPPSVQEVQPAATSATEILSVEEIGRRVWQNECGGTREGLTSWNADESFASLGIGHFIW